MGRSVVIAVVLLLAGCEAGFSDGAAPSSPSATSSSRPDASRYEAVKDRWLNRSRLPSCGHVKLRAGPPPRADHPKRPEVACIHRGRFDGVGAELTLDLLSVGEGHPLRFHYQATPDGRLEAFIEELHGPPSERSCAYQQCGGTGENETACRLLIKGEGDFGPLAVIDTDEIKSTGAARSGTGALVISDDCVYLRSDDSHKITLFWRYMQGVWVDAGNKNQIVFQDARHGALRLANGDKITVRGRDPFKTVLRPTWLARPDDFCPEIGLEVHSVSRANS